MRILVLLATSLAVALGAAECGLRLVGYSVPVFHTPDTTLGWVLRPGAHGWQTTEGRAWVRINAAGMRDREHTRAKPPGTFRIAVIGDSYVTWVEVDAESTLAAHLGRRLPRCGFAGTRQLEVLNFGVPGYGTAQEYLLLRDRALAYAPDLVLLEMTLGNDIENNAAALDPTPGRPFYVLDAAGRIRFEPPQHSPGHLAVWRLFGALVDHSRLLQLAHDARARYLARGGRRSGFGGTVLAPPGNRPWSEAWRVTEALLTSVDSLARAHGAAFIVVTASSAIQVSPDPVAARQLADSLGVPDLFYPDRRVLRVAAEHGIRAVALAPSMAREAQERGAVLHGFGPTLGAGHWNAAGHRVAASLIAAALCPSARP